MTAQRAASLVGLLLVGCSEYQLDIPGLTSGEGEPSILVTPTHLDFAPLTVGTGTSQAFTVQNVGSGLLTVEALEVEGSTAFTLTAPSIALSNGDAVEVVVTFAPDAPVAHQASIDVRSNDPLSPLVEVTLAGEGLGPWLAISPSVLDVGAVQAGCPETGTFRLQNVGSDTLTLSEVELSGDGQWALDAGPALPLRLAPGAYTTATVSLMPTGEGTIPATLRVLGDDGQGDVTADMAARVAESTVITDTFTDTPAGPVDILFAVDQSCSMDDDAALLGANFSTFVETLQAGTSDWQLGVVTYDSGCLNGGILTPDTPALASVFAEAVVAGEDREISDDEALLQLAERALAQTASGQCNAGLLRPGAGLHIIVVSDEPERSTEQASAWTWTYWLEALSDYTELLVISGVIDTDDCNEGDDGYAEIIAATGGEALSICAGSWDGYAEALAEASLSWLNTLVLSETPVPESIMVTCDGAPLKTGWRYEAGANAVVLDDLEPSSTVTVSYLLAETCP